MSINRDTSPVEENILATEVEGLRRLVEEQRKLIEKLSKQLQNQKERIEQLEAELRAKKKLKGKPKLSASILNQPEPKPNRSDKRAGSEKESKKSNVEIDEEITIQPDSIPENAKFNGYRSYDVQELIIKRHNIRFQIAEYIAEEGKTLVGDLPTEYQGRHYGPGLVCYVMYQHYQCRVPQTLIYEQLREWGIDISTGQVNRLLNEEHQRFEQEQHQVLKAGLETATYIHTDDTGARHQGKNGYCTVIGNEDFAYFHSSDSKSRENFLEILQAGEKKYVLNEEAKVYLANYQLPQKNLMEISYSDKPLATTKEEWHEHLLSEGIKNVKTVRVLTEAALLGGLSTANRSEPLRILSDGAGQFNVMQHGLCWVHMERGLRKLAEFVRAGFPLMERTQAEGDNKQERENIVEMQGLLWGYYQELKQYQQQPSNEISLSLQDKFDEIFGRCYIRHGLLNGVLNQIRNHKIELLQVLDCPEFPLHNNAAETDIREYVTRRKISGGTRSALGRKARDTFVGLKKTCRKLGISFWNYLTSRLHGSEQVLLLSDVIRAKAMAKIPAPT